jgi:hypothetical protein
MEMIAMIYQRSSISGKVKNAEGIIMAIPVYNFNASSGAKNIVTETSIPTYEAIIIPNMPKIIKPRLRRIISQPSYIKKTLHHFFIIFLKVGY